MTYWETSTSTWLSSFARGVVAAANMKLVQNALKVIFDSQMEDGTWRKGEPIFISGAAVTNNHSGSSDSDSGSGSDGGSSSGSDSGSSNNNNKQRDIGNSYVFFFDIIEVTYYTYTSLIAFLSSP